MLAKLILSAVGGMILTGLGALYLVHGKDSIIAQQRSEITAMQTDLTQRNDAMHRAIKDLQAGLGAPSAR